MNISELETAEASDTPVMGLLDGRYIWLHSCGLISAPLDTYELAGLRGAAHRLTCLGDVAASERVRANRQYSRHDYEDILE